MEQWFLRVGAPSLQPLDARLATMKVMLEYKNELALLSSGNQSDGTDTSLEQRRRHLVNQLSEPWQKQKQQELMAARSASGDQRVRRRKGHGKRKGPPITWDVLRTIDPNMTRVAILLAKEYGYSLVEPRLASATVQPSA